MAKLVRQTAKLFGSAVSTSQIAQFGSLAASSPVTYTGANAITNANLIQATNWTQGWSAAVEGANSPALEDLNAFCFMDSYQIGYLMQTGIPEWDSATTYYIGSVAQDGTGNIYTSLTNSNLNNALSSTSNWKLLTFNRSLTGSGGSAPLGNVAQSSSSSSFVSTSTTFVDVTNLNATITTSGRPVMITLCPDVSGFAYIGATGTSINATVQMRILRGVTTITGLELFAGVTSGLAAIQVPPGTVNFIDNVVAGTYTYKLQALNGQVTTSMAFNNCVLSAYEL